MSRIVMKEKSTHFKDRNYDDDLLDMIDDKLQTQEPAVKSAMKKFDNSHSTEKLDEIYDSLDMQQYITDTRDSVRPTVNTHQEATPHTQVENPFLKVEKKKQANYQDVVEVVNKPTIEIKNYTSVPVRPTKQSLSKRIKLWLVTGICCLVLLGGMITVAALNLSPLAGSSAKVGTDIGVEIGQLADEQGVINTTGETLTAENIGATQKAPAVVKTVTKPTPSTSVWDKVCAFFSHLFGG